MADPLDLELDERPDPLSAPVTTLRAIIIAALVALVVGCIPALATAFVVNANLKDGQNAIVQGRVEQTLDACARQNRVIRAQNSQTDYLAGIIINSAKQSKAFEKTYRQFGFPPYKTRLKQAKTQAGGLQSRKLPQ